MTDIQLTFYVANLITTYQITSGLYQHDNTLTIDLKKKRTLCNIFFGRSSYLLSNSEAVFNRYTLV
jgi:hypothetical protein